MTHFPDDDILTVSGDYSKQKAIEHFGNGCTLFCWSPGWVLGTVAYRRLSDDGVEFMTQNAYDDFIVGT